MKTYGAYKRHGQPSMPQADYSAGQPFGEDIRRTGDGIVYDSVRHVGGVNVVAYRPRKIRNVTQRYHYELTVPLVGRIVVRRLAA